MAVNTTLLGPLLLYLVLRLTRNCNAELYCIEEEANSVVVGKKPARIFSVEAPHVCVTACIKAKQTSCAISAFNRRSVDSNGTCFLYAKDVGTVKVKKRTASDDDGDPPGSVFSVYRLLKECPKLDSNITAAAKKYIEMGGRKVMNIEGRAGWGMPVELHLDDWGPWSAWSPCIHPPPVVEEISIQNRIRICGSCGVNRIIEFESTPCACCPVPVWLPWEPWSSCSVSCGPGVSVRRRACSLPVGCAGPAEEVRQCMMPPCAMWSVWGPWGPCIGRCGVGQKERIRRCVGVGPCPGPDREVIPCSEVPPCCTDWFLVGHCSASCGPGVQLRARRCEPANHPMTPHLEETIPCNLRPCGYWAPCMTWVEDAPPIIDHECMARRGKPKPTI